MVKNILRSPKLSKKGRCKCDLLFIATVLVALVLVALVLLVMSQLETSQVEPVSSLGLATRVLSHRSLPQSSVLFDYLFDLPSNVKYSRITSENPVVADDSNSMGLMEELPMKGAN